ncbi:MAG TPA: gas vesicle protein K [Jatrophihabitans sp.]|jgi:hypothetical protein|nr:gas vesicle protein K [Jatrophihabitans sp.]
MTETDPRTQTPRPTIRLDVDPDDVGRAFGQVVLAIAEVLRELLERQTLRRIEAGDLDAGQIERLGSALLQVKQQLADLQMALAPDEDAGVVVSSAVSTTETR